MSRPSRAAGWRTWAAPTNGSGMTGIAHLFEHMMFKGTPTIGTKDYKKDLEIIAAQERVRDEMRQEERKMRAAYRRGEIDDLLKPENKTPRYRELEKEFNKLIAEQREILVKNEFDRIYSGAGGSGMNAFTSEDMTAYFITVPANKLELWMWMESERILHPVFREFYAERDVVFEERRMRTESTPLGKFQEEFNAMFWESSPYAWPVVGWPSDIPAISKAQADDFYSTYYSPQNITLILVGDFKPDQGRGAGEEVLRAHPARPEDAAGRGDARGQAGGREAHVRRGGDESAGGHPLAHGAVPASRLLRAGNSGPDSLHADGAALQGPGAGQGSGHGNLCAPVLAEMGGLLQRRRRGEGRAHARGGRAGHLRQYREAEEGGGAAGGIAEGEEQLRRRRIPPALVELPQS